MSDGLDNKPLTFGKHKGKTPKEVIDTLNGCFYLEWAFENVKHKDVCSENLYRIAKGVSERQREKQFKTITSSPFYFDGRLDDGGEPDIDFGQDFATGSFID